MNTLPISFAFVGLSVVVAAISHSCATVFSTNAASAAGRGWWQSVAYTAWISYAVAVVAFVVYLVAVS